MGLSQELQEVIEKQKELIIKTEEAKAIVKKLHIRKQFTLRIIERSKMLAGTEDDEGTAGATDKIVKLCQTLDKKYNKACVKERRNNIRLEDNTRILEEKMKEAEKGKELRFETRSKCKMN